MKSIIDRAKRRISDFTDSNPPPPQSPQATTTSTPHAASSIRPITCQDIFRYRYHHGTNLGSIFVLERWLFPSLFSAPGDSELAAVTSSLSEIGLDKTKERWKNHWDFALSDDDIQFLVHEAKCTSIRLPIGYFTLGPAFCQGTPFEAAADVYVSAWAAVCNLVRRVNDAGIGVLLDVHALPGGANKDMHSGTDSGKAELWDHWNTGRKNREMAKKVVLQVVSEAANMKGIVGVQIVNEAVAGAHKLHEWYDDVLREIQDIDPTMPIYVSDAWDLNGSLRWVENRRHRGGNPVVVDTHKYYTFSEADRAKAPQHIISQVPHELGEIDKYSGRVHDRGAAQIVIGEYSCVLDGKTWSRSDPSQKDDLVRQFGNAQSERWREKTGGTYFWTAKMEWMDGGEWGFFEQVKKRTIVAPPWLFLNPSDVQHRADEATRSKESTFSRALGSHVEYWSQTAPGKKFEHHWYGEGWDAGWEDAKCFWLARSEGHMGEVASSSGGAEKIGCLEIWVRKRLQESWKEGGSVWEWEHGFRAGVKAFEGIVGL
ncbi:Glucan 1,3-beta-glucosidase 3 [Pseudogymnoascus destructans]|uniref:Glucan 1,3-beta-glucosidase 3 n=1 Tax=Pseudogymnoascus destructans TaxID=655981 RepID=A0A177AFI7_9PEZI|nr:Glucan 1,3-beta-glucosidase 3 [Pseudogymnoascus destructans]OAF60889.1 Glucan 1,3-beta-glucosidase 3 [Pseudogymnoascus destructans]